MNEPSDLEKRVRELEYRLARLVRDNRTLIERLQELNQQALVIRESPYP